VLEEDPVMVGAAVAEVVAKGKGVLGLGLAGDQVLWRGQPWGVGRIWAAHGGGAAAIGKKEMGLRGFG